MKINKLNILVTVTAVALLLLASCSNDSITETVPDIKKYTPIIQGTIGQLTDVATPKVKSGVIEDNPDYALGEEFYWHDGDQAMVLLFQDGDINSVPFQLIYTASVPDGTKPSSCNFTTDGNVPAGNYTVYALYPANGWENNSNNFKVKSNWFIGQSEPSSKHLSSMMFMKAKIENVAIGEGESNSINLKYKHLSSVARFHITDTSRPSPIQLSSMEMGIVDYSGSSNKAQKFFPTEAYLEGGIEGNSLTPVESTRSSSIFVFSGYNFTDKGTYRVFDVFVPILPTGAPIDLNDHRMYILCTILYENNLGEVVPENFDFNTAEFGLSFITQLPFLRDGFEAGKSYYFNLKLE